MSLATPIPVERLCVLAGVGRAGFYRYRSAAPESDPNMDLRDEASAGPRELLGIPDSVRAIHSRLPAVSTRARQCGGNDSASVAGAPGARTRTSGSGMRAASRNSFCCDGVGVAGRPIASHVASGEP